MWNPFSFDGLDVDDSQLPNISTDMEFDAGIVKAEELADDDGDLDLFRSYQMTKESAGCDDDPACKEDSMPDPEDDDFEESAFAEMEDIMADCDEDDDLDDAVEQEASDYHKMKQSTFGSTLDELNDWDNQSKEFQECGDDCDKDNDLDKSTSPFAEMNTIFTEDDSIDVSDEIKEREDEFNDDFEESAFAEMNNIMKDIQDTDGVSRMDECDDYDLADVAEAVLDDEEDDLIADCLEDMPDDDDPEIDADVDGAEEIEADIIDDEEDDLIDIAMSADQDEDVDYCDEE